MALLDTIKQRFGFSSRRTVGARGDRHEFVSGGRYFADRRDDSRRWADAVRNVPIVSASIRVYLNALAQSEPTLIPAIEDDSRSVELAEQTGELLFESPHFSWASVVRRLGLHKHFGFSILEWTAAQRADGLVEFVDLGSRPQRTITAWQTTADGAVEGAYQGHDVFLPREKLVYLADNALDDRPQGLGLLASVAEPLERLRLFETLERIGLGNDLRGVLIGRAPFEELREKVRKRQITNAQANDAITALEQFMQNQARTENQYLIADSSVFSHGFDAEGRLTSVPKFGVERLRGEASGLADVAATIERLKAEIATAFGTGFLLGSERSEGSRAKMQVEASQFSLQVDEGLRAITEAVQRDMIRVLFMLNDFPLELQPRLRLEESQFISSLDKIDALVRLSSLDRSDPAVNELRAEIGVSPIEVEEGQTTEPPSRAEETEDE